MAHSLQMLIDGQSVSAASGETSDLINPATGKSTGQVARAGVADVDAAVKAASSAFESRAWSGLTCDQRGKVLWRVAELIDARNDELALVETTQMGIPLAFSKVMVSYAAQAFRYYAGWCTKITGSTSDISGGDTNGFAYTRKEPVGVAGLIVPWNAPLALGSWKVGAALAAGCAAVLKPSEETPSTALVLGRLLLEAGLPPGVLNVVTGGGDTGAAMAAHSGIHKISFTGSTATGRKIIRAASDNFKRVTLELGGKSPCVILADADLDSAVGSAAQAFYFNSGQICTAGQRIYVQRPVYEKVLEQLTAIAKSIVVGDPMNPATIMGPLVSKRQFDNVSAAVARAVTEGAQVCTGGGPVGGAGYFFQPTVMAKVNRSMSILREETFGPAACVVPFDDPGEIVGELNDTQYGLAAYIWTRNLDWAHNLAARIRAGMIWINTGSRIDYNVPLGGYKASGWGRENGREGVEAYLENKSVVLSLRS